VWVPRVNIGPGRLQGSESLVNHRTETTRNLAAEVRSLFSYSPRNCTCSTVTLFDASFFSLQWQLLSTKKSITRNVIVYPLLRSDPRHLLSVLVIEAQIMFGEIIVSALLLSGQWKHISYDGRLAVSRQPSFLLSQRRCQNIRDVYKKYLEISCR
jgi:hypothetical protein